MTWFATPWKEVRDHKIVFVKREMTPIWITEGQAIAIRTHQGLWITIHEHSHDPQSAVLYDGKKSNIEQIIPMDWKKIQDFQWLRYFNDFWESRLVVDMNNDDSIQKYKCSGYLFTFYMDLKHGFSYAQDITKEKRDKFLDWVKDKDYKLVSATLLQEIWKLQSL